MMFVGLDENLCGYDLDGQRIISYQLNSENSETFAAIYEELPGWSRRYCGVHNLESLRSARNNYVDHVW